MPMSQTRNNNNNSNNNTFHRQLEGLWQRLRVINARDRDSFGEEPEPWITSKATIFLVILFLGFATYAYLHRIVIWMITGNPRRTGSRGQGIALLVLFVILFIMIIWSYVKICITSPGYSSDVFPESEPPPLEQFPYKSLEHRQEILQQKNSGFANNNNNNSNNDNDNDNDFIAGPPYHVYKESSEYNYNNNKQYDADVDADADANADMETEAGNSPVDSNAPATQTFTPKVYVAPLTPTTAVSTEASDAYPAHNNNSLKGHSTDNPQIPLQSTTAGYIPNNDPESLNPQPSIRQVPSIAVLDVRYRYCYKCKRNKPPRTHHCRRCGTCVLKMDHHCLWVGRCVGARNYKFFYNFLQWASLYCLFIFISSMISIMPSRRPADAVYYVDPVKIVVIVISAIFALFTSALLIMHTYLTIINVSTLEDITINRMRRGERARIAIEYNVKPYQFLEIGKIQRRQDQEWGRLRKEANPWWLGSSRANWEMVMGRSKLGWFLPIDAKPTNDDGLSYKLNPRFGPMGEYRRRSEWPSELQ